MTWLTDAYSFVYFNSFVLRELAKNFMKRVIVNGFTGSNWRFKRFEHLSIISISINKNLSIVQLKKMDFIYFEVVDLEQNQQQNNKKEEECTTSKFLQVC